MSYRLGRIQIIELMSVYWTRTRIWSKWGTLLANGVHQCANAVRVWRLHWSHAGLWSINTLITLKKIQI